MTAEEIIKETTDVINSFDKNLNELNEKCVEFTQEYDKYARLTLYDASLLKEEMKKFVIQAVPSDI